MMISSWVIPFGIILPLGAIHLHISIFLKSDEISSTVEATQNVHFIYNFLSSYIELVAWAFISVFRIVSNVKKFYIILLFP